jgi:hypothetical protein
MRPDQDYQIDAVARRLAEIEGTVRRQRVATIGLIQSIKEAWIEGTQATGQPRGPVVPTTGIKVLAQTCELGYPVTKGVHFTISQGGAYIADGTTGADGSWLLGLANGTYSVLMDDASYILGVGQSNPLSITVTGAIANAGFNIYPTTFPLTFNGSDHSFVWDGANTRWEVIGSASVAGYTFSTLPAPFGSCNGATVTTPYCFRMNRPTGSPLTWTLTQLSLYCPLINSGTTRGPTAGTTSDLFSLPSTGKAPTSSSASITGGCGPMALSWSFNTTVTFDSAAINYQP